MKKVLALVLALAMVLSLTAAVADGSRTTEDTTTVTTTTNTGAGQTEEEDEILLWKVEETEETAALVEELQEAKETGDISKVFPEEMKVSPEMIVADIISLEAKPAIAEESSYTIQLTDVAGVKEGKPVYVYVKVDDKWFNPEAKVPADNTVDVTFAHDSLVAMGTAQNISLVVLVDNPAAE